MSKALVNIKTIASSISGGMGDSTGKYEFTLSRHLLSGWRELNLFLNQEFDVKTQILEVDNVINCPCDFVYETKVGVRDKVTGRIAILSLDRSVKKESLNQDQSAKRVNDIFCGEYSGDYYTFYNAYRRGDFLGELYGQGRGVHCAGYYSIDKKLGEIYIGSLIPEDSEIVIEYKSDGISDGLKLVPSECELTLSYWAKARFYEEKKDWNAATWNNNEYEKHYNKLKRLYNFQSALYASAELNKSFSPTNY